MLPGSGITISVSTLPWRPYDPRDHRQFLAPSIYTPMSSPDYHDHRHPALEAIMALGAAPSLQLRLEPPAARGDSLAVRRVIEEARDAVANRYRRIDAEVNSTGYSLLNSNRVEAAIVVLRENAHLNPRSANAWDSLGEAMLKAGRMDEAIEAYRRALGIDPEMPSARAAMDRLGSAGTSSGK